MMLASKRRAVNNVLNNSARVSKLCRHSSIDNLMTSGGGLGRLRCALRAAHDGGSGLAPMVRAGTLFRSTRSAESISREIARQSRRACSRSRSRANAGVIRRKCASKYGPPRSEMRSRRPLTRNTCEPRNGAGPRTERQRSAVRDQRSFALRRLPAWRSKARPLIA